MASCSQAVEQMVSAVQLLQYERHQRKHIFTFSQKLDHILGGGIATGLLTEVCGLPGTGKTQLCLQVCVDAHLPQTFGGLASEAVYIDTDNSFDVTRLKTISIATVQHCKQLTEQTTNADLASHLSSFTEDSILNGIYHFSCVSSNRFLAVVDTLAAFLEAHPKVRVIVIDSITFPFRNSFNDNSQHRVYIMLSCYYSLLQLARQHNIAILITNQMTTRFSDSESTPRLVPALGESWSCTCTTRVMLSTVSWDNIQLRSARIIQSSYLPDATALFQIQSEGIRDVPNEIIQAQCENLSVKRLRIR